MSSIVDCELAHQSVPPHRGWGFGKMTGTLRYGMLAPGCITQSPQDGCSRGGELKSPNRMVSLPSVSNVMAYGGMPQKYTQLPVSFVSAHNRVSPSNRKSESAIEPPSRRRSQQPTACTRWASGSGLGDCQPAGDGRSLQPSASLTRSRPFTTRYHRGRSARLCLPWPPPQNIHGGGLRDAI